jgi:guanylate kinase
MIIVVGPSGVGKSSFVDKITAEEPSIKDIITYTTRNMRTGESEGYPYHFVTEERFKALISDNFFVEWANVHGKLYGTPRDQIEKTLATPGEAVIMDVDVQGAKVFQNKYKGCLTIFIHPPNMEELKQRIIKREGKPPIDIHVRLDNAKKEIAQSKLFDKELVNDEFSASYAEFKKMVADYLKTV